MTKKKENRFEITWWLFKCSKMKSHNAIFQKKYHDLSLSLSLFDKQRSCLPGLVVFVLGGKVGALVDGDDQGGLLETILHLQNKVVENIRGCVTQEKCEKHVITVKKSRPSLQSSSFPS